MRALRSILGIIGVFFCATLVLPAARRLEEWWQIRSGQVFYVEGSYLREGLYWLAWALVALVPIVYAALRPRSSPGWLILGFGVVLVGMAALPSSYGAEVSLHRGKLLEQVGDAGNLLAAWGKNHGRLPGNQAELEEALRSLPQPSPFARAGQSLPYHPVYVGTSGAAQVAPRPGDQPGMLLYTTNADQTDCWLTAEGLGDKAVSSQPVMVEDPNGGPWTEEQKLPVPPPAAASSSPKASRQSRKTRP